MSLSRDEEAEFKPHPSDLTLRRKPFGDLGDGRSGFFFSVFLVGPVPDDLCVLRTDNPRMTHVEPRASKPLIAPRRAECISARVCSSCRGG